MHEANIYGFLVGEALMREPDPGVALTTLFQDLA
jgi:indole-3-glycerol phosphate synthase